MTAEIAYRRRSVTEQGNTPNIYTCRDFFGFVAHEQRCLEYLLIVWFNYSEVYIYCKNFDLF